jgi:hypothetical protein
LAAKPTHAKATAKAAAAAKALAAAKAKAMAGTAPTAKAMAMAEAEPRGEAKKRQAGKHNTAASTSPSYVQPLCTPLPNSARLVMAYQLEPKLRLTQLLGQI